MGSLTLAYPSIAGKTTQEQLESMRRYLCSVTEQLNLADWSAKATLTEISQAIDADSLSEAEKKTTLSGYGALKALIIKTADFAAANSETWSTKLSGSYVAISDFGKYLEKTQLTIEGNSVGIKQLYDYTAGVNNQFSVNSQQFIKTGLLYFNDVTPVYGVGVGNIETTVTDGGENVIDRTKNELVTVTPDRTDSLVVTNQADQSGYKLPSTGGAGTKLYTTGGVALMLAALVCGVCRKRRRERRAR